MATSQNETTHETKYFQMGLAMKTSSKGANAISQ
jgi:hypothetical protein